MTQNKTELQDALHVMYEVLRVRPDPKMLSVYEAAQAYADLPSKIEGMLQDSPPMNFTEDNYNAGRVHVLNDILDLLNKQKDNENE